MSNQSSVEWFIEQLEEKGDAWENVSIRRVNISIDVSEYMELKIKAKAMHKEEMLYAIEWGNRKGYDEHKLTCIYDEDEQYYNETFGGTNENNKLP